MDLLFQYLEETFQTNILDILSLRHGPRFAENWRRYPLFYYRESNHALNTHYIFRRITWSDGPYIPYYDWRYWVRIVLCDESFKLVIIKITPLHATMEHFFFFFQTGITFIVILHHSNK